MLTVGELKEFLSKFDDDTVVITRTSNYEMRGSQVDAYVSEAKYSKKTEHFRDDFDGTNYRAEIYVYDDNGNTVVRISG